MTQSFGVLQFAESTFSVVSVTCGIWVNFRIVYLSRAPDKRNGPHMNGISDY